MLATLPGAAAVADKGSTYYDEKDKFYVDVPAGWTLAIPEEPYDRFRSGVSSRRTLAWISPLGTAVNMVMIIVPAGADYTSLGSYGTAADFGTNLVTSMDRSFVKKGGQITDNNLAAKLVSTRSTPTTYFVDYTSQRGVQELKYLYSAVALGVASTGQRRFYTLTGTVPDSLKGEMAKTVAAAVASFRTA